ncbi:phage tail protein [Marinagarivorans algicola]|uniref:phage tail protein n=1 Tax=Marinagarivorans algicola TaxID=1513270 RepID=UPI0006B58A2B|nr:phage tail protein [Marinagarivorans algicola]
MNFISLVTNKGLEKISRSLVSGYQVILASAAVGDGKGEVVVPSQDQTHLVNAKYRADANIVSVNAAGDIVVEFIVPADQGGFTVRELAVYDEEGDVFAVANTPEIYKPLASENANAELVLRMVIAVENSQMIQLTTGSGVLATRDWVETNFASSALIPGGFTGQVLSKASNLDGDTQWKDPANVNVTVNTREEERVLAAGDVQVDLEVVTAQGLAVYADGVRVSASQWVANTATQIEFLAAFSSEVNLVLVQNEPSAVLQAVAVGQVVFLDNTASPKALFGYGVWERVSSGRFIVGQTTADVSFNVPGKTGGAKGHKHSGRTQSGGVHNHGAKTKGHSLTVAQMPEHSHRYKDAYLVENERTFNHAGYNVEKLGANTAGSGDTDFDNNRMFYVNRNTDIQGDGDSHDHAISADGVHAHDFETGTVNSLPPYYVLAIWKRVA